MNKRIRVMVWCVPFALHCGDALAWGLYTHLYFAQLLLWAVPLADPHFRRAVRRFPEMLFAGACLPDVALFSSYAGARELRVTHQWSAAHRLLDSARTDTERALAVGYSAHLLTDVIAHNYFVPAHETLWLDTRMATHAAAEWAMDAHIAPQVFVKPAQVLSRHIDVLAAYAARHFACDPYATRKAVSYLMRGECTLRAVGVSHALYHTARTVDRMLARRFDYYARETALRLTQLNRIIEGDAPAWRPEVECAERARANLRVHSNAVIACRVPLPPDLFDPVRA
ncbi:MAG: zinc dependent phospholipase C family protein [Rhodospirillaceae bacterium]